MLPLYHRVYASMHVTVNTLKDWVGLLINSVPLPSWVALLDSMKAGSQEGGLQVSSSLILLSPVSKVCSSFSGKI